MIQKNTEEYRKAQEMANLIFKMASYRRTDAYFEMAFNKIGRILNKIEKLGNFASQVSETILKTMNPYGYKIANISSKQAWIIACTAVENKIELND